MTALYDLSSLPATFSMMASPSARNRRRQQTAGTQERHNLITIEENVYFMHDCLLFVVIFYIYCLICPGFLVPE